MDKKDQLIEKLKELVEALNGQVALVCGDFWNDAEKYGYSALALSQKITKLESEISTLEYEIKQEQIEADAMRALHHASEKAGKESPSPERDIHKDHTKEWFIEQLKKVNTGTPNVITDKGVYDDDDS